MNDISFKRIGPDEFDLLIKMRIDFCMRDNPECTKEEYNRFLTCVTEWTRENIASGNFLGYAGFIQKELACFAGLLTYVLPPIVNSCNRKQGHVLSFFTYPEHRRKGLGRSMMDFIIKDSKSLDISQLVLNATIMGEPLYRKSGFCEPMMKYMVLHIEQGNL